jgi:hypothetical protein
MNKMIDKILAFLSVALLIAFLGVVPFIMTEFDIDLVIVIVIVCLMAIYDFWSSFNEKKSK